MAIFKKKSKHSKTDSQESNTPGASPHQKGGRSPSTQSANNTQSPSLAAPGDIRVPSIESQTPPQMRTPSFGSYNNPGNSQSTPLRQVSNPNDSRKLTPQQLQHLQQQQRTPSGSIKTPPQASDQFRQAQGPNPQLPSGHTSNGTPYSNMNHYNGSQNTDYNQQHQMTPVQPAPAQVSSPWKKKRLYNSPFPRFSHAASSTTSETGAIFLMGGLCGKNVFGDMWVIEPANVDSNKDYAYVASPIENFERVPAPRIGHSSVLIGNAFIVFAGDTVTSSIQVLDNKLYFFNITSLKWTITSPEGPKPEGRYGHQISVLNFETTEEPVRWLSYLYVFGGQLEDEYFNDIWTFDLSNFRNPQTHWVKLSPKPGQFQPPPLANHTMTAYNDKLFIYGGSNSHTVYGDLLCFEAASESWTKCKLNGNFTPPPLQDHSAALYQNLLFIYGGKNEKGETSSDLFIIDLNNFNCFKILENLPNSPGTRCGHSLTIDAVNEKLIIMGGDQNDKDFTGVVEIDDEQLNDSHFDFPSSVIYEFDLPLLSKYMDRSPGQQQALQQQLQQQNTTPNAKSMPPLVDISTPPVLNKHLTTPSKKSVDEFIDAEDSIVDANTSETPLIEQAPTRISQHGIYEQVSEEEEELTDRTINRDIAKTGPLVASTPLTASEQTDETEVPTMILAPEDDAVAPSTSSTQATTYNSSEMFKNPMIDTPMTSEFEHALKTPQRTQRGIPASERSPINDEPDTPNSKPTHPLRIISSEKNTAKLGSPMVPSSKQQDTHMKSIDDPSLPSERSTSMFEMSAPAQTPSVSTVSASVPSYSNAGSEAAREAVAASNGLKERSRSPASPQDKQKLLNMVVMLQNLRVEMNAKVEEANERIVQLESEKTQLSDQVEELEMRVNETSTGNGTRSNIGDDEPELVGRSKIQYENRLLYLQHENQSLNSKLANFEPFMKEQINQLEGLNDVLKKQQDTIQHLESRLIGESELQKQLFELESKYKSLSLDHGNLKSMYGLDSIPEITNDSETNSKEAGSAPLTGIHHNVNVLSSNVDNLLNIWSTTPISETVEKSVSMENGDSLDSSGSSKNKDEIIAKLQSQVDELLTIKESETSEAGGLKAQLDSSSLKLKELEDSYKKSIASLNNTHRALTISQNELEKQKEQNKKLSSELSDLQLKKRNVSSSSAGQPGTPGGPGFSADASPGITIVGEGHSNGMNNNDEEDDDELDARYGFKIRDLEADLFIVGQERDQLREELVALKKKLFSMQ